jgi:hypothetical protein
MYLSTVELCQTCTNKTGTLEECNQAGAVPQRALLLSNAPLTARNLAAAAVQLVLRIAAPDLRDLHKLISAQNGCTASCHQAPTAATRLGTPLFQFAVN